MRLHAEAPPNLIVIMTDDQRADTMAQMPRTIGWLAEAGVTFTQARVVSPLCGPTRASLLTGLYPSQHGIWGNRPPQGGAARFDDDSTVAVWLHAAGYRTGLFGKYINQSTPEQFPHWPYVPPGWDDWLAFIDPVDYFDYRLNDNGHVEAHGRTPDDYSTTVIFRRARAFIEQAGEQPFFALITPNAPHPPFTPLPSDLDATADLAPARPPSFNEPDVPGKPAFVQARTLTDEDVALVDERRGRYLATLSAVDREIDALMAQLARLDLLQRTVVIFFSDNGYVWGEHRLRNGKQCAYEECLLVPLIVRTPSTTEARTADPLVSSLDLTATIADLAGVTPPRPLPGKSLRPFLENREAVAWPSARITEWLGDQDLPAFRAVHEDEFVYIEYIDGEVELYDLDRDPYQLVNLAPEPEYRARVASMRGELPALPLPLLWHRWSRAAYLAGGGIAVFMLFALAWSRVRSDR